MLHENVKQYFSHMSNIPASNENSLRNFLVRRNAIRHACRLSACRRYFRQVVSNHRGPARRRDMSNKP